ncbi:MAG TPA: hypothetical protein DD451_02065 [Candidatus Moranbacteria bacterium]|nr:hypothetical protein [Candidatus Moranbacteria bacterium]
MKKISVSILVFLMVFSPVGFNLSHYHYSASITASSEEGEWLDYENYYVIDEDVVWSGEVDLSIELPVVVVGGATLTIEKGTRIILGESLAVYYGRIVAEGTEQERITFTSPPVDPSFFDDECFAPSRGMIEFNDRSFLAGADSSILHYVDFVELGTYYNWNDFPDECFSSSPIIMTENWGNIFSSNIAKAQSFPVSDDGEVKNSALKFVSGRLDIKNSTFKNNLYADIETYIESYPNEEKSFLQVSDSNFFGNGQNTALISTALNYSEYSEILGRDKNLVRLENNWYGSPDGPALAPDFSSGGEKLIGDFTLIDWSAEKFICKTCTSNVLFLPGIKSSRLYKEGMLGSEDKLWIPNYFGDDMEELRMDEDGKSIEDVYTRDILDEVAIPVIGGNIYKTFLEKLDGLKSENIINDFRSFAYDWRQSVEDIAQSGTLYPEEEMKSALEQIEELAESSKNEKVTIVAHSNGGLLAKSLMMELEKSGATDKIDKIIFVATPQIGTPVALLAMLYGYDEPALAGTLISQEDARTLAENMPGAYGLLPSEEYFDRIENPFVSFSSENTRYKSFKDAYGDDIDDFDEWKDFLTGDGDGRQEPENSEVDWENTLRENLLDEATEMHKRLDSWIPPENVEAIQIAGWGLDTISGVKYSEREKYDCFPTGGKVPSCVKSGEYAPTYQPQFTVDGDKTVVAPSALMIPENDNVKRYWVDLFEYNKGITIDRGHKNILEVDNLQEFISNIIANKSGDLPKYIKDSRPDDYENASSRLRMSLHSPLDIHLYDEKGNHTGPKKIQVGGQEYEVFEEGISNSYYYQFGERKYVGFGSGENVRVELEGYGAGTYTLKVEEAQPISGGEETVSAIVFANLPTTEETTAVLEISEQGLMEMPVLQVDIDGDGQQDYQAEPIVEVGVMPDSNPPQTFASAQGEQGLAGWFVGNVAVSFSAEDGENEIEKTQYSLDGGASWEVYENPIEISGEGIFNVRYFSTDTAGNEEDVKEIEVKMDKTAPEGKIFFNPDSKKLEVFGIDNLSGDVSVRMKERIQKPPLRDRAKDILNRFLQANREKEKNSTLIAVLIDKAGHSTIIDIKEKNRGNSNIVYSEIDSISYDGVKTDVSNSLFQCHWNFDWKKNKFQILNAHLTNGSDFVRSFYFSNRNETRIWENGKKTQKIPGLTVPYLQTEKGSIKIFY